MTNSRSSAAERIAALPAAQQSELRRRLAERGPSGRALTRPDPLEDPRLRLFCFPYAGAGGSVFRSWSPRMPDGVEVVMVTPPGREHRLGELAHRQIAPLVEELAGQVGPLLDRPYAFFGHSMGALVAFELARRFESQGAAPPELVMLSAFRSPDLPNPNRVHDLPDEVLKVVLRREGVDEKVLQNEELMAAMLPTLRADFEACDSYRYTDGPPLSCPLALYAGAGDARVPARDLEGWRRQSTAEHVSLTVLPGTHFFLHTAHEQLTDDVSQHLARALDPSRTRHVA